MSKAYSILCNYILIVYYISRLIRIYERGVFVMVPSMSIFFMAVSAAISIGLPIVLFLFLRKKYGLKIVPCLVGCAAFIVFALVLEQLLHMAVLRPASDGNIALRETNPLLYCLYGIFAAGIFEETARLLSFNILKKKYGDFATGLSYGIGHGGIESIILAGVSLLSSIVFSIMINSGNTAIADGSPAIQKQFESLIGSESILFLFSGIERILAISVHISLSIIVWHAVMRKGKLWLYPVAISLHALVNLSAVLYQVGIITSVAIVEALVAACAIIVAFVAFTVTKKLKPKPV